MSAQYVVQVKEEVGTPHPYQDDLDAVTVSDRSDEWVWAELWVVAAGIMRCTPLIRTTFFLLGVSLRLLITTIVITSLLRLMLLFGLSAPQDVQLAPPSPSVETSLPDNLSVTELQREIDRIAVLEALYYELYPPSVTNSFEDVPYAKEEDETN